MWCDCDSSSWKAEAEDFWKLQANQATLKDPDPDSQNKTKQIIRTCLDTIFYSYIQITCFASLGKQNERR